jgi:hypothetical protein
MVNQHLAHTKAVELVSGRLVDKPLGKKLVNHGLLLCLSEKKVFFRFSLSGQNVSKKELDCVLDLYYKKIVHSGKYFISGF